jgi:DNA polymerase (family 10)
MDKVFQAAKDSNVALEINSQPNRLDLRDVHIRKALEYGCKFIINTDSHSVDQLENINLGIGMARRGWLESKHVVNTLPLKSFERWVYSI